MAAQIDPATIAGYFQPECKRINLRGHAYRMMPVAHAHACAMGSTLLH